MEAARKQSKDRHDVIVARFKAELLAWIEERSPRHANAHQAEAKFSEQYYSEITAALLETAIDREIRLLDAPDALDMIKRAFHRQAAKHMQSIQ